MKKVCERWNKHCGVAMVRHPSEEKDIFVVFAWLFDDDPETNESKISDDGYLEVGAVIGAGKTKEFAMMDAIKNLVQTRREYDIGMELIRDGLKEIIYAPKGHKEKIVVPITIKWDEDRPASTTNCDVFINEEKKLAELGQG